jgi:hypothetical protein
MEKKRTRSVPLPEVAHVMAYGEANLHIRELFLRWIDTFGPELSLPWRQMAASSGKNPEVVYSTLLFMDKHQRCLGTGSIRSCDRGLFWLKEVSYCQGFWTFMHYGGGTYGGFTLGAIVCEGMDKHCQHFVDRVRRACNFCFITSPTNRSLVGICNSLGFRFKGVIELDGMQEEIYRKHYRPRRSKN